MTVTLEVDLPADLARFHLPEAVNARLQTLLDRQDSGKPLTLEEREEAEGLVDPGGTPHPVAVAGRANEPMSDVSPALHAEVVLRARNCCEYCQLSQLGQEATFHIDHVTPRAAGGPTTADNLALACVSCSLRKWANETAPDAQHQFSPFP